MMARSEGSRGPSSEIDEEAAAWFARMRGPDRAAFQDAFDEWRTASAAHGEAYARAERLWRVSADLATTRMGRARSLPERRVPPWQLPGARPAFAALAVLLIALAGLWWLRPQTREPASAVAAAAPIATPIGEIRSVRLADGSTVTLDTDSAIQVSFTDGARLVRLTRGRARFDVAHDAARPFRVEAAGRTVTALGTLFDVGFGPEGVKVTLFRGSVDVRGLVRPGGVAAVTRLSPGQCLTDLAGRPGVAKASRGAGNWVSGMLDFDGVRLVEVLEQTNRYSPRKIRLGDPSLNSLRVTGAFRPLPLEELAAALATAFSLDVRRGPGGDLVLARR